MRHSGWNKAAFALVAVCLFMSAGDAFAQWNAKVILNDYTTGQPALAPFQGKLHLGWVGADGNRTVNVMSAWDGLNYGDKVTLWGMTSPDGIGVSLSEIPGCGSLALSYLGRGNNYHNFTQSWDGVNWTPQNVLYIVGSGTPALTGASWTYGSVGMRIGNYTGAYLFDDCSLASYTSTCFFFNGGYCYDGYYPINGGPAWSQSTDVRGFSQQNAGGQLAFGTPGGWDYAGSNHSPQGPSIAYAPGTGYHYMAWRSSNNGGKKVNIYNLNTGAHVISGDWSDYTPAISVFDGQIFVAWRGGSGAVNIGRMNLF